MSSQPLPAASAALSNKTARIVASLLLLTAVLYCLLNADSYYAFLVGPFFAYGLASTLILQIRAKVPPLDYVAVLLIAVAFFCCDWFGLHYTITWASFYSFAGLASVLVFGMRTIWSNTDRELLNYCFLPALALAIGMRFDGWFLQHSAGTHAGTFDLFLYSADCSFGIQASYLVGQLFLHVRWLLALSIKVYEACMIPLVLTYAVRLADRKRAVNAFWAFVIAGPLGVLFFLFVPGTGPFYAFPHFPVPPLPTAAVAHLMLQPIVVDSPRNAIPSLHMTWALLGYYNARRGPLWLRVLMLVLAIDTALATLGTGQHYLVDLIAAVPFSLMVQALASTVFRLKRSTWIAPFLAGLGLTLLWLATVSYGVKLLWVSTAIPWALMSATFAVTAYFYVRLRRKEDQGLAN